MDEETHMYLFTYVYMYLHMHKCLPFPAVLIDAFVGRCIVGENIDKYFDS